MLSHLRFFSFSEVQIYFLIKQNSFFYHSQSSVFDKIYKGSFMTSPLNIFIFTRFCLRNTFPPFLIRILSVQISKLIIHSKISLDQINGIKNYKLESEVYIL